jgi:hypothetical protein
METFCNYLGPADWRLVATIGIPGSLVVLGWFFVHRLNSARDIATKRREARIKALEVAYMRIATSSNRALTEKIMDDLEYFVSEIQLYGTPRQVELMGEMVEAFKASAPFISYDALLLDLRDTIRDELKLEKISGNVWWFRFTRNKTP